MIQLTLNHEKAWVIREGTCEPYNYFMAHTTWTRNPWEATIFRDYDAADKERYRARRDLGFIKDSEILDVVPYEGVLIKHAERQQKKQ